MTMNPDVKAKWLEALRSGRYRQGTSRLSTTNVDGEREFCCLGVLCELAAEEGVIPPPEFQSWASSLLAAQGDGRWDYASEPFAVPPAVTSWSGVQRHGDRNDYTGSLADLNDTGTSFEGIANIIEETL